MRFIEVMNRWLPPPRMLRAGGLGVDISESAIKYLGFKPSRSGLFALALAHHGQVTLEKQGAVTEGEINDIEAVAAALAEIKARTGVPYVHLSLPEERVYLFETDIDDIGASSREIRQQVEFRLEENVPISPRDAYFDFEPTGDGTRSVVVTVCAREVVEKYYEVCRLAKVVPLSFEVESAAIARAVLPHTDRGTRILLDFGKTRTGLGIVHDSKLLYTSTVEIGGDDLSAALYRTLGERSEDDVTKLKNELGLVKSKDPRIAESLLPIVSAIKDEIQSRIQYWNGKHGATRSIDHLIISGGSANLRGAAAYLSETLGIEATLADVWQNAFDSKMLAPAIDRRHSYGYATAIGLALTPFTPET